MGIVFDLTTGSGRCTDYHAYLTARYYKGSLMRCSTVTGELIGYKSRTYNGTVPNKRI